MTTTVRTAIFPVAGLGTRFLPATKVTPKELLPVLDTPLIDYAIEEARNAGVERMVFVSHPAKEAIERHVMDDVRLRRELRKRGKADLAAQLKETAFDEQDDDVVFTMQENPLGLGDAVLRARPHVLPGAVAVLLPDDLILGGMCLSEMVEAYSSSPRGHLVASMPVEREETRKYGILDSSGQTGNLIPATGMVEKPEPDNAPSCDAVVGRYVLDSSIFDDLATQAPGAGGEIQLTDAIARGASRIGLAGYRFSGQRFDCGSKSGMLRATIHMAEADPECREVLDETVRILSQPAAA